MKRAIIDFKKLTPELAGALLQAYPQGYGDEDIITFKNASGDWVEAVSLQTSETLYLVKIGKNLNYLMSHFEGIESETDTSEESAESRWEEEYDGAMDADALSDV